MMSKYSLMNNKCAAIRAEFAMEIARALKEKPELSYRALAKMFGCGLYTVVAAANRAGINRVRGAKPLTQTLKGRII